MTKEEKRVIEAAIALCRKGRGFCFFDGKISDEKAGRRLEDAVAALLSKRKGERNG